MRPCDFMMTLCAGTTLVLSPAHAQTSWSAIRSGNWSLAGNWAPANVPDADFETAILGFDAAYTATVDVNIGVGSIRIENPLARIAIARQVVLSNLGSELVNNGTILVNATGGSGGTYLNLAAGTIVSGSGLITLNNSEPSWAQITTTNANTDEAIIGPNITINGNGGIFGRLTNRGTVAGGAGGNGPQIRNIFTQEGAGKIRVSVAGQLASIGDGGVVQGGTIETSNGGIVHVIGSTSAVRGTTNLGVMHVARQASLHVLTPGFVNDGTILVNGTGGSGGTYLNLEAGSTISGSGLITLNNLEPSWSQITTTNANTDEAIIGPNITINGNGGIFGRLTNRGTVAGGAGGNGPQIRNIFTQEGAGKIRVSVAGQLASIGDGGVVQGGTIETSNGGIVHVIGSTSSVRATTNLGTMHIARQATLNVLSPGLVNNGTIFVNGTAGSGGTYLNLAAGAVLSGSGTVTLNNIEPTWAQITTTNVNTDEAVIGPGVTINGNGGIFGRLTNRGTVAGGAGGNGPQIRNIFTQEGAGKIRVTVAGQLASIGDGGVVQGGTIETSNGGIVHVIGSTSSVRATTNLGTMHIARQATLNVLSPGLVNNGTIFVNGTAGSGGTYLTLSAGAVISGTGTITLNNAEPTWAQIATTNGNTDEAVIGTGITINGTGGIYGRIVNHGTIAPGAAIGSIRRDGAITQGSSGVIEIQLAGSNANQRDSFIGNGTLTLDGTLRVGFLNNYVLPQNATYVAISGGSIVGRFARVQSPTVNGRRISAQYTPTSVTLYWTCAADFNEDGFVDFFDYADFVEAFESGAPGADVNNDGFTDFFDYGDFVAAFEGSC